MLRAAHLSSATPAHTSHGSRGVTKPRAPRLRAIEGPLATSQLRGVQKVASGTAGLDEILDGGFPRGRPILVCGGAGCGKTLLGMQFLVRGALDHGEPGVFIAFEEKPEDLAANVASLGFDLQDLEQRKLLSVDHVQIDPTQIVENGDYDLTGLFLRIGLAIDTVGAKRVVIDTLETLFGGLTNYAIIRAELRRLFEWLKDKGVTALITAERGVGTLTRHGLEEYVSDCVLLLDHRVNGQISTRRLRVVKYRGSAHGTNEYPFFIDRGGITVIPITSVRLEHNASDERVSSGIAALDAMLGSHGYFRGSTILLSGTAGAGKSSVAAHFAAAACERGERAAYFAFEESPAQIMRNMRSIGLDLRRHVDAGLLRFVATRPTAHGLETHLALIYKEVEGFRPTTVVLDPASTFIDMGAQQDAHGLLVRLIDHLKQLEITALLTNLTSGAASGIEHTEAEVSSIVDTWLLLKTIELSGERNRGLYILKSRGMDHSNQIREFRITRDGIELVEPYIGPEGVLTGSARQTQEARERGAAVERQLTIEAKQRELARIESLHRDRLANAETQYRAERETLEQQIHSLSVSQQQLLSERENMALARGSTRKGD
jgi:circadian clock protein KaiC